MTKERIQFAPKMIHDPSEFRVTVGKGWQCWVATVACNDICTAAGVKGNTKDIAPGVASTKGLAMKAAQSNIMAYCYKMERV